MYCLPTPYRLRPFNDNAEDAAFAAALYRSTRDDLRLMPADPAFIADLIAMQQRMQIQGYRQAYPQADYLVLEQDGAAIGRLVLDRDDTALRIVDIAILPQAQGQGAGSAVLGALQAAAAKQDQCIRLGVSHGNLAARAFYARLGFHAASEDALQQQLIWSAA
ncbi:GNAT family N-acetyltransferase [Janthinobacterium agaricidamnosum]|uniref:Acetyltransferase family protein n=1 Tax=Janthinobacterium agaricidamnosum NBRC 102515 = DSM 9628 TaxID=1349767 RepID=W0V8Y7_9BURK|nr:GNAT family N-acetyltransferase [Janthinobacterium agaricidamnosum]CDG84045.1 acetyltransferase family protein [Janthinobacterium agaricidamnosum NBRC 102515 = DSM 9628]